MKKTKTSLRRVVEKSSMAYFYFFFTMFLPFILLLHAQAPQEAGRDLICPGPGSEQQYYKQQQTPRRRQ